MLKKKVIQEAGEIKEEEPYILTLENFSNIVLSSDDDDQEGCEDLIRNVPMADRGKARKMIKEYFAKPAEEKTGPGPEDYLD